VKVLRQETSAPASFIWVAETIAHLKIGDVTIELDVADVRWLQEQLEKSDKPGDVTPVDASERFLARVDAAKRAAAVHRSRRE